MRILMVGGSGFVGTLVRPGLCAVHDVTVLDPVAPGDGCDWVPGSATDPVALAEALVGVDVVIHAAMGRRRPDGTPDPASAFEINVSSVYATLAEAGRAGVRRALLIGSLSVFGSEPVSVVERPVDEATVPDAVDVYGLTKRLAEVVGRAAAEEHGMGVTVLRLAFPTPEAAWPAWALPIFPEPVEIRRADGTVVPALAASDLTSAVLAALDHDEGGFAVFHVVGDDGSGRCWSTAKAREVLGWRAERR